MVALACPPMFLKITSALPGFIYASDKKGVYINLFIGSETENQAFFQKQRTIKTRNILPLERQSQYFRKSKNTDKFPIKVRIPGWAQGIENPYELYQSNLKGAPQLCVNGKSVPIKIVDGMPKSIESGRKET